MDDYDLHYFDEVWRKLSEEGKCDGIGGVQYERVKRKYLLTADIVEYFIINEANDEVNNA